MVTKDEALKMAIEALDTLMMEKGSIYQQAIQACKEALEQPQKQWVDLTDDEISRIWFAVEHEVKTHILYGKHLAKAIQAKFKELNT